MTFFGNTLKKSRRLSIKPLQESLHLSRSDFNPASFHKDQKNHFHLISYNPTSLFNYGFINPRGSTLTWGLMLRTLVMCAVGTLASQLACPGSQDYKFCFPVMVSGEGLIFASLVSFLLGLFISTTFSRWWSIRDKLGLVMNNITLASLFLHNFAPHDEATATTIKKVIRWMHLGHALIYKQANNDNDYSDLVDAHVATREEAESFHLSPFNDVSLPPVVYSWASTALEPVLLKFTPTAAITPMIASVTSSLNASQEISAFLKTQMPFAYLHLLALLTKLHLALIIFYSGGMVSQGIKDHLWTRIILGYTIIITNSIIYDGLLRVHEMLYNPLGDDSADFPTHLYQADTMALANFINIPPPREEEHEKSDII